jgi:hypothetical protein
MAPRAARVARANECMLINCGLTQKESTDKGTGQGGRSSIGWWFRAGVESH